MLLCSIDLFFQFFYPCRCVRVSVVSGVLLLYIICNC